MPINIPESLPARSVLENENIFVMTEERATRQDIRPLRIAILNLMPKKIETETQLLRLLSNSSLQVNIELLQVASHTSKNTSQEHLLKFYRTFDDIKDERFDGLIITGAPVEELDFEQTDYWEELKEVMDWADHHAYSTFYICWAAMAGLYHHFGVPKHSLSAKKFGVFSHTVVRQNVPLLRGFDDVFFAPHSRHTEVRREDIEKTQGLTIVAESEDAGPYIIVSNDGRHVFVTGHSEYDPDTLAREYFRDLNKGLPIAVPKNYFPNDDTSRPPRVAWRSHGNLLYSNWLNYYVYQETPFDITMID